MTRRTLVIFARAPELGRVKSRLARGIGQMAALAFYRHALTTVSRRLAADSRWRTILAVTPDRAAHAGRRWPVRLARRGQRDGDLGARMARTFRDFPKGQVVIIGADIPEIEPSHIARAFSALGASDIVFGPARDGGYWLIGAKGAARAANMFAHVRWSTKHALADTRANLNGRRVALVDVLNDIDDARAYERMLRRSGSKRSPRRVRPSPSA